MDMKKLINAAAEMQLNESAENLNEAVNPGNGNDWRDIQQNMKSLIQSYKSVEKDFKKLEKDDAGTFGDEVADVYDAVDKAYKAMFELSGAVDDLGL